MTKKAQSKSKKKTHEKKSPSMSQIKKGMTGGKAMGTQGKCGSC